MSDINLAERRLIAALDRLDHAVERAGRRAAENRAAESRAAAAAPHSAGATQHDAPGALPAAVDAPLSPELAALHDRQAATLEAMRTRLAEAHERLALAGEQAARLSAANDDLSRANRALVAAAVDPEAWASTGEAATRAVLEAEIEALRAARAAEVAQMGEILDALDRMLGVSTTPRSHSTAPRTRRNASDDTGESQPRDPAMASGKPAAEPADSHPKASTAAKPETAPDASKPTARPDEAQAGLPELTVIRDEDPLPEDSLPEDPRDDEVALFGGVYDDDPDSDPTDRDDEERR